MLTRAAASRPGGAMRPCSPRDPTLLTVETPPYTWPTSRASPTVVGPGRDDAAEWGVVLKGETSSNDVREGDRDPRPRRAESDRPLAGSHQQQARARAGDQKVRIVEQ